MPCSSNFSIYSLRQQLLKLYTRCQATVQQLCKTTIAQIALGAIAAPDIAAAVAPIPNDVQVTSGDEHVTRINIKKLPGIYMHIDFSIFTYHLNYKYLGTNRH